MFLVAPSTPDDKHLRSATAWWCAWALVAKVSAAGVHPLAKAGGAKPSGAMAGYALLKPNASG